LKLANRAFVRAVTQRPLTLTSRLSLSKIDADMVNYVEQQIGGEKERALSAIKGWSTVSVEGSLGVMTKEGTNGEKLTVRLNTNGTMPQKEEQDELEEAGKEVLCHPDFEVIIEKGDGMKCMFFNCSVETDVDNGEDVDPFEIHSVSMADKDEKEPYVLNMDVMEDDFYDGMYSFLEDRGINDEFCEELVSICTDLEANNYRQLLIDMKSFVQ